VDRTVLLRLSGISDREFNLSADAGIEAYRHRHLVTELFGDGVAMPAPSTPPISYGHINGLGIDLVFPESGEVNYCHENRSLEECIAVCRQQVDFGASGMAPHYLEYRRRLQEAFPGEQIGFAYSSEGPLTTAYELRGMDVFTDAYDDPQGFKELLDVTVRSVVAFRHFQARLRGAPEVNPSGFGLYDDVAAMFSPSLWPELVLPYFETYYRLTTTGRRMLHTEDLTEDHLRFLEGLEITDYDPSISHKLNPQIIARGCRVPFRWLMGGFHFLLLDEQGVRDWVFQAVADGASCVFTRIAAELVSEEGAQLVRAFADAASHALRVLAEGASREEVGALVSAEGRRRFWKHWPE
jgi:hypothetical protein